MTLALGDAVTLEHGTTRLAGHAAAIRPWRGVLIETNEGLYLEVVFNISAVSWMRIIRLDSAIKSLDAADLDDLITRIAHDPKRQNLDDIPEAHSFCPKEMQLTKL